MLCAFAYIAFNSDEGVKPSPAKPRGNVEFTYGEGFNYNTNEAENINETLAYDGHEWVVSSKSGYLVRSKQGFRLHLVPGETVIEAEVSYSDSSFANHVEAKYLKAVPWDGSGLAPLRRNFVDKKDHQHNLHIDGIAVVLHKPHSPQPPPRGEMAVCTALSHKENCGWWE